MNDELLAPAPAMFDGPEAVRWAVGSPTGPRSHTWMARGCSNQRGCDDIYISTQHTMGSVKISLHDADPVRGLPATTRLAFTQEYAKDKKLAKRLIEHWEPMPTVALGWRHELTIATPTTTFGAFDEKPCGDTIQWWAPPPHPEQLAFHVYVGDPEHAQLTLSNHIGDVCQMPLRHGRCLWIVAQSEPMHDSVRRAIEEHLAGLPTDPTVVYPFTLFKHGDHVPVILDLAGIWRPKPPAPATPVG
ncbi:hypothetical protein ACAG26_06865 [Mycobacterium sp. pUA109]|uniref:hypothetical protein n=1 Tax=Mycobacterium sp. pUA109 TaxID=3238982 RepID=UPI00351BAAEE